MVRRAARFLALALGAVGLVLVVAACRILQFQLEPEAYPPPIDALQPVEAQAVVARLVADGQVTRDELDLAFAPTTSTSVQLLVDGQNFYPLILHDLSLAQSSIHIDQYGFTPGEVADQFVTVLGEAVQRGVTTRLIVDRMGSSVDTSSQALYERLRQAGVNVVTNDPFILDRDGVLGGQWLDLGFDEIGHLYHRKVFIVDGRVGWVGGAGIEDYFYDGSFHDVFVRFEGAVVSQLQAVFLTSYVFHGAPLDGDVGAYFSPLPSTGGGIKTALVSNVPGGRRPVTDAIEDLIENAAEQLDIIDPYVSDRATLNSVAAAAKRGVKVRFIVPLQSNAWPVQQAFNSHIDTLQAAGVDVRLHPILPHAKVIRADDRVLVGSTNLDAWALYRNWEISLVYEDRAIAELFDEHLFAPDAAVSSPAVAPAGLEWLLSWVVALFTPLL